MFILLFLFFSVLAKEKGAKKNFYLAANEIKFTVYSLTNELKIVEKKVVKTTTNSVESESKENKIEFEKMNLAAGKNFDFISIGCSHGVAVTSENIIYTWGLNNKW